MAPTPFVEAETAADTTPAPAESVTFDTVEHPPTSDGAPFWDIRDVMHNAIYVPDPPKRELQETNTVRTTKASGHNMTRFCVSSSGKPTRVRTIIAFPDDPDIDRICLDTVSKWRFKPFLADGKAIEICSDALFNFTFN